MKSKIGLIICLVIVLIFFIFTNRIDHQSNAKRLAEEECILVVETPPSSYISEIFKAKGYDPITKKPCECNHYNRWWSSYKNQIKIGDTIVKKKGELVFSIHKKDSTINYKYRL
ncbi:hypothetical protein J2787_004429 [Chryseobacterium rhizosphaerae]|uniref:DUF4258 domain-containing protein n=1 Tax=Chryseobacterium rhizosphaerae TaxID=395937 RepID=A0AAE3YB82_9FLAO|nr:hypothetical protein [Chryseobacterium rhizosphaerae]MDR6528988.1 hypothetical protein [Chryseobacterium rhizosphaerae]